MTNDKLTFRDMTSDDLPAISGLVEETWDWKYLFERQESLDATVGMYLNTALHVSSFIKVAMLNHKPVGVIMGYVEGDEPKGRLIMDDSAAYALRLLSTTENDRCAAYEYISKTNEAYATLLKSAGISYDANLVFLALSKKARGLNIGKKLWLELLEYFKQKNVHSVYLFSDTECNFGFYDHMGFTRRAELEVAFSFGGEPEDFEQTIFLYDFRVLKGAK